MKRWFCFLLAVFTLSACVFEIDKGRPSLDESLEGKPVTITFSVPNVVVPSTKSFLEGPDGDINKDAYLDPDRLYVVVCGSSQSIKYIRKAEFDPDATVENYPVSEIEDYPLDPTQPEAVTSVTLYTFKVQLEISSSERTIHFLGNIDENQLITGEDSYLILPKLLSYEGKQAYWQKVNMPDGIKANLVDGTYVPDEATTKRLQFIPLIRNYAKILVTNQTDGSFELHSYAIINYPKRGSVVPYRARLKSFDFNPPQGYRFSGYEKCDFPVLDETLHYDGNLPESVALDEYIPPKEMFEDPSSSGGRVIEYNPDNPDGDEQGFYVYERGIPTGDLDPTFIIIRGRFDEDSPYYYYKIDLMETAIINNEAVYQYYPIYRNFRYNIQINRIIAEGVSTPELAALSSGVEDISADKSMIHLADISNGSTRLVVEPYMARTFTGPKDVGYYEIYARFFNNVNSSEVNTDVGAVTVELERMEDDSPDILVLYDDQEHEVHGGGFFFPAARQEDGVRVIRFNLMQPGNETKTQKIKITGRNLYSYEPYPLYREVEISLQQKQIMQVDCSEHELARKKNSPQSVAITIPAGLPDSMFPLEFKIEAEDMTLTPDSSLPSNPSLITSDLIAGKNLPVKSGPSFSDNPDYAGRTTFYFIRTLTLDEYKRNCANGECTFYAYFKSNINVSATTIWVDNEYFIKNSVSFTNPEIPVEPRHHFYVEALGEDCTVTLTGNSSVEYRLDDEEEWHANTTITLERGHRVYFKSTYLSWNEGYGKFTCTGGDFSVGGNIASLFLGDDYEATGTSGGEGTNKQYTFVALFKNHTNLIHAKDLVIPMKKCNKQECFKSLFEGCTNLVDAPALPATTLSTKCYRNMFYNCSSLEKAPDLPAENLVSGCYQRMFYGCTKLTYIKLNAKEYRGDVFLSDGNTHWAKNAGSNVESGTPRVIYLNPAIKNSSNWATNKNNVIPAGWSDEEIIP